MDIFKDPSETPYKGLVVQEFGGALFVDVRSLLDILEKRAMMRLRTTCVPGVETHIADFNSGQYHEMLELYKVLGSYVNK